MQFLEGGGGRIFYFCHNFWSYNYPRGGGVSPNLINAINFTVFGSIPLRKMIVNSWLTEFLPSSPETSLVLHNSCLIWIYMGCQKVWVLGRAHKVKFKLILSFQNKKLSTIYQPSIKNKENMSMMSVKFIMINLNKITNYINQVRPLSPWCQKLIFFTWKTR